MNNKKFIKKRIEKFKEYMAENSLDTAIITRPENIFYFSNFNPIISSKAAYVIISTKKDSFLLVHSIRCDHAKEESLLENVQLYGKWGANIPLALDPIDAVKEILTDGEISLGLEYDYISLDLYNQINSVLNVHENKDIANKINDMKIIKDEYEISCIRKAAAVADVGIKTAIDYLQKGYTEAKACTEGQYQMRQYWHKYFPDYEVSGFGSSESGQFDALAVWCLINERISYGCDCPKNNKLVPGDLALPMSWAKIGGYTAECERVVYVNELDKNKSNAYDAMLEARENIFKILKPEVTFDELYMTAAKCFEKYGFGWTLPGRVGHGIGISPHEILSVAKGNRGKVKAGMVFTVEPGIMVKEWGGVRHADTVVITDNGFECLTKVNSQKIKIHI